MKALIIALVALTTIACNSAPQKSKTDEADQIFADALSLATIRGQLNDRQYFHEEFTQLKKQDPDKALQFALDLQKRTATGRRIYVHQKEMDSLNQLYISKGFAGFCDALASDDSLYSQAALIQDQKYGMDNHDRARVKAETALYKMLQENFFSQRNVDIASFRKDMVNVTNSLGNPCAEENLSRNGKAKQAIKKQLPQLMQQFGQ